MTIAARTKFPILMLYCLFFTAAAIEAAEPARTAGVPASYFAGGVDRLSYGPSALRIAPNGTFWIANPADNTLTNVDRDLNVLQQIDLRAEAAGISDVYISPGGEVMALDAAADPPAVLTVSERGNVRHREVLQSLQRANGDSVLALKRNGDEADARTLMLERMGRSFAGRWQITPGTDVAPNATLTERDRRIDVKATHGIMRGARILRDDANGVFVLAEEVFDGDTIVVDATVRHYSHQGTLLGSARIPLNEQFTYVENPVDVSDAGEIYMLATKPERVDVIMLTLTESLPDIRPVRRAPVFTAQTDNAAETISADPIVTRAEIEATAWSYWINKVYYPQNAITGSCSGRIRPRFLTTPGVYQSVAYDWGGFDGVAAYNAAILAGERAGDIDDRAEESCSRGVDCSGFVSRTWGLGSKRSSCTLSNVSTQISTQALLKGDILTKCDVHVVLFDKFTADGIGAYEATTYNGFDRVVYLFSAWSRVNGYTPRRYNNVAGDPTTPVQISTGSLPASGPMGMVATFQSTWKNADNTPMTAKISVRAPSGQTSEFTMAFVSGQTTTGALFEVRLVLPSAGRYDYFVTVTSTKTGRSARYPSSGYTSGPYVNRVTYSVTPSGAVCGQVPVTIRVSGALVDPSTVRFTVTKGNNSCGLNGKFLASGVVDLREGSPSGPVLASVNYSAGAAEVNVNYTPAFTSGARWYYATIRNQGYLAGPVTITAR